MKLSDLIRQEPDASTLNAWLERVPYAKFLGMRAKIQGDGILFTLPASDHLIGNASLPAIHGGVVGAFMEQAAAIELVSKMPEPVLPRIIDFSLDYLRPTRARETYARCTLTRQGSQVANVAITAWQERLEEPTAMARAHFLIHEG